MSPFDSAVQQAAATHDNAVDSNPADPFDAPAPVAAAKPEKKAADKKAGAKKGGDKPAAKPAKEKAAAKPAKEPKPAKAPKPAKEPKVKAEKVNGIAQPKAGSTSATIWGFAEALGKEVTRGKVIEKAKAAGINEATAATQYARWRSFNGLTVSK